MSNVFEESGTYKEVPVRLAMLVQLQIAPQFGALPNKADVGKICLTNSKAAYIVCSRSSDVSING